MTIFAPLGAAILAQARLGDGKETTLRPRASSLPITYTIAISKYVAVVPITYTIERRNVAPLLLYYQLIPPTQFAINGNASLINPDHVTYTLRPVANRTLIGGPLLQGIPSITWNYAVLQIDEYDALLALYTPQNPLVVLTYPDESGIWQQRQAVMQPPTYGTRQTVVVTDIALTFLFSLPL
jgi:hypothetical protein